MKKKLKIGRSDFGLYIKNGYYLVDKTKLIYEFHHNSNDIILFPRPKRFGKTLNLSMIEYFYDIQKKDSKELFSQFEIAKQKEFCDKHQNKYPVINISLKDIKETSWQKCYNNFKHTLSELYEKYNFLLKSEKIEDYDKEIIKKIIRKTADEIDYKTSLYKLSKYLKQHFKKEVIILVDEYDTPIINAFNNTNKPIKSPDKENKTYYETVIGFMQTFLGRAYKGNENNLYKGMITGVMRVGRESIFSEWNNFSVFGITSNYFSDSFGFTQKETEKILSDFNLANKKEEVKQWYDGYRFGKTNHIYNPWSIVNYIGMNADGFKPYWINSGDYSLIKSRMIEIGVSGDIQELIEGKTIEASLYENFVFQDFETGSELFWTLLTDNGYLTLAGEADFGRYKLKIPNKEVKIIFTNIIKTWIDTEIKLNSNLLAKTAKYLITGNKKEFEQNFRKIVGDTLSYFDTTTTKKSEGATKSHTLAKTREQIYHVYTLGLLAILTDDYIIKSNRESGEGRYDIILIPYDKSKNGVVIEIKSIEKQRSVEKIHEFSQRVNKEISNALNQIDRNRYYAELIENNIKPDNIIKLAIVFAGKEPYINEITEK